MPKPPHDSPVFFVDRSLGGKIVPDALRLHGWNVERHDDHFHQTTLDTEWITNVGKKGWVILTADAKIRFNPLEREALLGSNTFTFVIAGRKNLTGKEMALKFIAAGKAIEKAMDSHDAPAVFRVIDKGRVELMLSSKQG